MAEANEPKHASGKPKPSDLIGTLDYYLVTKAPYQLPANVREWVVKYGPWLDVLMLILLAPAVLLVLGIGAIALPFAAVAAPGLGLALVVLVAQVGLLILALPGLFTRKMVGWNLTFYGVALGLFHSLLSGNIIGGLVSVVISCYVLFQIRSYYR